MTTPQLAWGPPDATGIAVGLGVISAHGKLVYQVGFANRSTEKRHVTLFATLDGRIRTRLVAVQGTTIETRPAIMPAQPITAKYSIDVDLAPGEVVVRDGTPARFELTGAAQIHVAYGGVSAHPIEIHSGDVAVDLRPG